MERHMSICWISDKATVFWLWPPTARKYWLMAAATQLFYPNYQKTAPKWSQYRYYDCHASWRWPYWRTAVCTAAISCWIISDFTGADRYTNIHIVVSGIVSPAHTVILRSSWYDYYTGQFSVSNIFNFISWSWYNKLDYKSGIGGGKVAGRST